MSAGHPGDTRRTRLDVDPEWRIEVNREQLKAAAMPKLYKGYKTWPPETK